jgi:hypothetical protein
MSVSYTDNTVFIQAQQRQTAAIGLRLLMSEIARFSEPKTPRRYGSLRRNKTIQVLGLTAALRWNVKYAAKQESTKYRHYTTAGTGPHFAENAVRKGVGQARSIFRSARYI